MKKFVSLGKIKDMSYFSEKTVWVTGASSGIGEALAYEFSRQGAKVILSSRKRADLERVAKACAGETLVQTLDLAKHDELPGIAEKVISEMGRIDILVNNGGISQRSLAKDTDLSVDRKMVEVNLLGTIAITKAVLPYFIKNKNGHFVTITSLMGKFGAPMRSGYAAAKHGLHGFFDTLRAEVHKDNIKVTLLCPGYVRTNISKNALTADGKAQGIMDEATDAGLTPEALAKKILRDIKKGKREALYGGKETLAVYLKRFFPGILARVVRNVKTT